MSFVVLHADRNGTVMADDPVISGEHVDRMKDALALFAASEERLIRAAEEAEATATAAHAQGYRDGFAEGRAAADETRDEELLVLARRGQVTEEERRGDIARLAIEVVRRIAGDIGAGEMVAALAERAAAAVLPDGAATIYVAPSVFATVQPRLAGLPGVTVDTDAKLAPDECVIATALGRTHAGLETQLERIARRWSEADAA